MPAIETLSPEVAGKIAAGEVIERPASVVKELIDNSLDAGSARINVEVYDGGKSLIRVSDDGIGIPSKELPAAVQNFSTSKIRNAEDILNVRTLGFRGEALASIRSVSHLTVSSRARDEDIGREMQWRGQEVVEDKPLVKNPGVEITVKDLFSNLPARRKFMSSGPSEIRRITSLMQSYALSFPETSFTLKENRREILSYPASTLDERAEIVFGSSTFPNLTPFEGISGRINMRGFTSLPHITRGNRSHQFLFVNKRHVKDRMLGHAVRQAYQSLIPGDRFPLVVLFLEVPTEEIDINVHPTKAEIRFRSEREIHRFVSSVIREALQVKTLSFREKVESVYRNIFPQKPSASPGTAGIAGENHGYDNIAAMKDGGGEAGWILHDAPLSLFDEKQESDVVPAGAKLYWQLHQSFILIQIRGGMVVVDQHAAHERILFNEAKKNLVEGGATVQSLLFPATLDLSAEEYERYEEFSDILPSLGFEVEPFGIKSVIVRGIPAGVRNWNDGRLLQEILNEKGSGKSGTEDFLKTFACRSSIKAGTNLSIEEMENLTDQLFATEFPFTCPHGRPTMLRVDISDLERRFHRTVTSPEK